MSFRRHTEVSIPVAVRQVSNQADQSEINQTTLLSDLFIDLTSRDWYPWRLRRPSTQYLRLRVMCTHSASCVKRSAQLLHVIEKAQCCFLSLFGQLKIYTTGLPHNLKWKYFIFDKSTASKLCLNPVKNLKSTKPALNHDLKIYLLIYQRFDNFNLKRNESHY